MPCPYAQDGKLLKLLGEHLEAPERAALLQHLEESCADCEQAIAELGPERFGAALARRGEALLPPDDPPSPEEEEQAFSRVMRGVGPTAKPRRSWLIAWWPTLVGAAATVILLVVLLPSLPRLLTGPLNSPPPGRTQKGGAAVQPTPGLHLWFDVASWEGGQTRVKARGADQGTYPASDLLVVRFSLEAEAFVAVVRIAPDGQRSLLYRSAAPEPAGTGTLRIAGQEAAFPLTGLSGKQRFWALASLTPISEREVLALEPPADFGGAGFGIEVR